jgi:hypothetical protein
MSQPLPEILTAEEIKGIADKIEDSFNMGPNGFWPQVGQSQGQIEAAIELIDWNLELTPPLHLVVASVALGYEMARVAHGIVDG